MSKTLDILDCKGDRVGDYVIPDNAFELEKGEQAVRDAVVAFLAEQRAGTASTKTRGEVRGGGAKPFRQKGTGRARAGSSRSPIWLGGGVTFGPQPRSYAKKLNKKIWNLALKRAFSERIVEGGIVVVDKFEIADHKTKSAKAVLDALKVMERSVLLATAEYDDSTICATGNLSQVVLRKAASVNVYELLRYDRVLFTKDGLDRFIERLGC